MNEPSTDLRLSAEERSLYRMIRWFFVWPLLFFITRRMLPEVVASALSAFVFVAGSWFVDPSRRKRIAGSRWIAVSIVSSIVIALITFAAARV